MATETLRTVLIVDGVRVADSELLSPLAESLGLRLTTAVGRQPGELVDLARDADVFLVKTATVSEDLLTAAPRLHLLYKTGILCENIDTAAAARRGIEIRTIPIPSAIAVAEHSFCLMLATARHLLPADKAVREGHRLPGLEPQRTNELTFAYNWAGLPPSVLLNGSTLGLIGMGEIGTQMAIRAAAFGMQVIYHKRNRLPVELEKRFSVSYVPLEDLLGQADFVSLHLPYTSASQGLLSRNMLALMKTSAILINTSRGGIVDESALIDALASGALAGAGLDVFVQEPLPMDSPLLKLANVVLTPHIAGAGMDAWRETLRRILRDIAEHP